VVDRDLAGDEGRAPSGPILHDLEEQAERYNTQWLLERHDHRAPAEIRRHSS
jgi:hypothetical protein